MSRAVVVRTGLAILALALVAPTPLSNKYPFDYTWYWAINWDHGFVRRGLSGEIAQRVSPHDLASAAQSLTALSAAAGGLVFLTVGVWLVTRLDPVSVGVGLTLTIAPVGVWMQWTDPRPESFGYLGFVPLALALFASGWVRDLLATSSGLLVGVVALMSENVLFAIVPWMVVLVLALTDEARRAEGVRLLAFLLPLPVAAGALLVVSGRANAAQVAALQHSAASVSPAAPGYVHFVGDSYSASVVYVVHHHLLLSAAGLGTTAVAVAVAAGAAGLAGCLDVVRRITWDRWLRLACLLPLLALVIEMFGGVDWPRWLGQQASGAVLVVGLFCLLRPERHPARWDALRFASVSVGICVLIAIPPVPYLLLDHNVVSYWFSRVT